MVHAAALAATSPQIDRLINGKMKEADSRCAELRDVSVDDFARFCEYAYRGDYATPAYRVDEARLASNEAVVCSTSGVVAHDERNQEQASLLAIASPVLEGGGWPVDDFFNSNPRGKKKSRVATPTKKSTFRTNYQSRKYLTRNEHGEEIADRFRPQYNTADDQDFTPVFLAHARLYTFARTRMIDNLKALTLDKLHKALAAFQVYENRISDIVELARYAYSSEYIPGRADDGKIDELRDLVVSYIATEYDVIGKATVFVSFLEEGGEFVGDFCQTLLDGLL